MKVPPAIKTNLEIIDYRPEHQPWFEKLNRDWIEKYFWMEPIDFEVLQHPDKHIIQPGGAILMAMVNGEMAGTSALKFSAHGIYEFTKMGVHEKFIGQGIGKVLTLAAIQKVKDLGGHTIILYSSTKLKPAISLYRKLGFVEVPVDGPYVRSDIKMKLVLDPTHNPFSDFPIRRANVNDASLLMHMARATFENTFREHNTKENMELYLEKNYTLKQLTLEINDPGAIFLIAFDGDIEIGYAKLRQNETVPGGIESKKTIEIERLYVIKEYIGKHVGSSLMQASIDLAKKQSYNTLWLGVWEHNHKAIAFYEKWGFEKFSHHPFILGHDVQTDILMKKKL
jgi:GNAT superfamily N-acetyltransferase